MPVNCVIKRDIPGTLYLPTYWATCLWVGVPKAISHMVEQQIWYDDKSRLYHLKHGFIWKTKDGMWRLNTDRVNETYFVNFKGQWVESVSQTIVTADPVTHHELYIEELFLL